MGRPTILRNRNRAFWALGWLVFVAGSGLLSGLLSGSLSASDLPRSKDETKGHAFFEAKIRPLLSLHCLACHSAEAFANNKLKGGLYLDSREGWVTGGDTGPALVAGSPESSLLLKAVHYQGELHMPPKGKLPPQAIRDFETWIKMGAPDPRTAKITKKQIGMTLEKGRSFWSYRPILRPPVPQVKNRDWSLSNLDRFLLKGLEDKGLNPVGDTDKATLLRRVYFDLIGLPPNPEQVQKFLNSTDPKAFEAVVDQLLADYAFAERWGRHWLDISRYGDSVTLRGFVYPQAWRYRDYVIDSIHGDVPLNRIIREQIAGDLLPFENDATRSKNLIATTYLALGNSNLEEQDKYQLRMDVVDEMLDVIGKGLLGQTVTCARCHDHKFDPIPSADYYALAGIFRNVKAMEHDNVSKWIEVPLLMKPELAKELAQHDFHVADLERQIKALKGKATAKGIVPVSSLPGIVIDDEMATKVGIWQHSTHSGIFIGSGYVHDQNADKGKKTLSFTAELPESGNYEVRLAYSAGTNRSSAVSVTVFSPGGEKGHTIDMTKPGPIDGLFVSLGEYRFEKSGQSFVLLSNENSKGHVTADAVMFLPLGGITPTKPNQSKPNQDNTLATQSLKELEKQLKTVKSKAPDRPMAMSVVEEKTIEDARIHIRGLGSNLGRPVPRGVLQVALYGNAPLFPKDKSGRLELADWIVSPQNPLTPRVMANRVWTWLMGQGIVRTVDNLGTSGEPPTHPELLDYLATEFLDKGWSLKALVRQIVLSRAYRLSSVVPNELARADPENRLWGRSLRKRLDAEEIRDAMLWIAGNLDPARQGPGFPKNLDADYGFVTDSARRSIYLPAFRNALPEIFEVFDFPDTSVVTGRRNQSIVAPQALYMLNAPFPAKQAALLAGLDLKEQPNLGPIKRIQSAYERVLGRSPTPAETQVATRFFQSSEDSTQALEALYHALFASADFRLLH